MNVRPDPDAAAGDGGSDCFPNELNLEVVSFGDTERYYLVAEFDGQSVALQLDTGSGLTFIFTGSQTPDYTPNVGDLVLGCETIPVAGRGFDAPGNSVAGYQVVGLVGMDFLLRQPSLLEVEQRRLTRFESFPSDLVANRGLYETDFESVADHVLLPLQVDGTQLRLLFDTGGGHTLWVGQQGRPGDRESLVRDFEGNTFPIFTGSSSVSVPGGPLRRVPVARAPMFPYFEDTVRALGGNIQGLAGVTSFPGESLLFSGVQLRLFVLSPDN